MNDVKEREVNQVVVNRNGANSAGSNPRAIVNGMPAALASRLIVPSPAPEGVRTLDQAREKVEAFATGQWDAVIARKELAFQNGELVFCDDQGTERRLNPTRWASGQLCARLGIPASYFHKCPPQLQDVQANHWLAHHAEIATTGITTTGIGIQEGRLAREEKSARTKTSERKTGGTNTRWLLRANGETLRAVLSERYSPLDNPQLLECLRPLWQKRYSLDWFALCDESLHLRIVDPSHTQTVHRSDGLTVGVHISNSEVGLRCVTVDALVYRLVCSNGLIKLVKGKSLLRQRHIHLDQPRFVAALEEAVNCAWGEAEVFLDRLRLTVDIPVSRVEETVEGIGERWHLSETVQQDVLSSLRREPARIQETLYGVVNAFTNAAQRLPDEGRYDLEVLAGHLAEHGVNGYAVSSGGKGLGDLGKASGQGGARGLVREIHAGCAL